MDQSRAGPRRPRLHPAYPLSRLGLREPPGVLLVFCRSAAVKAVAHTAPLPVSDPACLIDIELPKPRAEGRDLLVKVEAISVNPVDTKRRLDSTKSDERPRVLGWDAAGIVEAVGEGVTLFKPGDAVYYAGDVTRPGCNSEFHLVDERIVGRKPKSLDFPEAAAIALTAITAWEGFFERMH